MSKLKNSGGFAARRLKKELVWALRSLDAQANLRTSFALSQGDANVN